MKVCEKVQKKGITTYNEVADELVAEFSSADSHMSPNDAVSAATASHLFRMIQTYFLKCLVLCLIFFVSLTIEKFLLIF